MVQICDVGSVVLLMYEDSTNNSRFLEDCSVNAEDIERFGPMGTTIVEANSFGVIHSLANPSESLPATTRCSFLRNSVREFPMYTQNLNP